MNNNLLNRYNVYNNPTKTNNFTNNLTNNLTNSFNQRLQTAKIEHEQKKHIADYNLSKEQLTKYVICPVTAEKQNKEQAELLYKSKTSEFAENNVLSNWWESRSNTPYKTIIKETVDKHGNVIKPKDFTNIKTIKKDDLIVHKITEADKDVVQFDNDFDMIIKSNTEHNNELKTVYSIEQ